eukprot:TRINITY_DN25995_c0_g1_i1.p1 TRINITY_DN25995_c0_g1~~TRINITY_DN25995_c0_g1_i1.p1  ORF type:complete len:467 (+),score=94.41 TRINITY_DN25995_c0_g1_i1:39-1439(+)
MDAMEVSSALFCCMLVFAAACGILYCSLSSQAVRIDREKSFMSSFEEQVRDQGAFRIVLHHTFSLLLALLNPRLTGGRRKCCNYGFLWLWQFFRLGLFTLALLPAFLRVTFFYMRSSQVRRGIRYGENWRNTLDVYLPEPSGKPATVLVFYVGGAWIIGYKAWGALMAKVLCAHGILVVCPDYRNFPGGRVVEMLEDVDHSMRWVFSAIAAYGGDPERIFLAGQSAGAHLSATALIAHAQSATASRSRGEQEWKASDLAGCILISGPFDLIDLAPHMHSRGLSLSVMHSIFKLPSSDEEEESSIAPAEQGGPLAAALQRGACNGRDLPRSSLLSDEEHREASRRLRACSPIFQLTPAVADALPRVTLLHGTADSTCPSGQSEAFQRALLAVGAAPEACTLKLYEGKTHTSPILEDPISGTDALVTDILAVLHGEPLHPSGGARPEFQHPAMCPKFLIDFARWIVPF